MAKKKRQKRGFLVALLVGFNEQAIHIWKVFSQTIRGFKLIKLARKWKYADNKQQYHFHEDLVNAIRPIIKEEGIKSILLASPPKTDYSSRFIEHVNKHHQWLVRSRGDNQVSFGQIIGIARTLEEASILIAKEESVEIINETTSDEADLIINHLEKSINANNQNIMVLYGLKEIEDFVYKGGKKDKSAGEKADYLVLTDIFLDAHKQKNRIHRLIQIAENKGVLTRIISSESSSGSRINQFGGIICFKKVL